jgi:uncharacterized membrane protein SpoIIM required for sporulation
MSLERFIRERGGTWTELEKLIAQARGRAERLDPEGIRRLGALYRSTAADLALARRRFPNDPVRTRLEDLVRRAGAVVYHGRAERTSVLGFFTRTVWVRIAERPVLLLASTLFLVAPAILALLWAMNDPGSATSFVPSEFQGATDPPKKDGTTVGQETAFTAYLFTNNIRVTLIAFALGITAGIGTAAILAFNGILLGTVAGLAIEAGNGSAFLEFIIPHGPIELSCVVVAGAAGLRLGWAIVDPGNLSRGKAIAENGRAAIEMVLGAMPWLVAAGLSEAFVRGSGWPLPALMAVGLGLFGIFWGLVYVRGTLFLRREQEPGAAAGGAPTAADLRPALASSPAGTS